LLSLLIFLHLIRVPARKFFLLSFRLFMFNFFSSFFARFGWASVLGQGAERFQPLERLSICQVPSALWQNPFSAY
jgi:hypothetical protein